MRYSTISLTYEEFVESMINHSVNFCKKRGEVKEPCYNSCNDFVLSIGFLIGPGKRENHCTFSPSRPSYSIQNDTCHTCHPIKDTRKEVNLRTKDKPKVYTVYKVTGTLSTKDKMLGPKRVLYSEVLP